MRRLTPHRWLAALAAAAAALPLFATAPATAAPAKRDHVAVAVVVPITVPGHADGLIPADELANLTAPAGDLDRQLQVVHENPLATIAIDPMVIASIRVLGTSAPATAQEWLATLSNLPNDTFPLQYGDADPALEVRAGLTSLLGPTAFGYAMNPADFGEPLTVGESTPPVASGTPSPSETPASPLPPLEELVDWPYTLHGIAWPGPASVRASDLKALSRAGITTTILDAGNTNASALPGTANAPLPVAGGTALVANASVSSALQRAASSPDPIEGAEAVSALRSSLADAAASAPRNGVIVAVLDRTPVIDAATASEAVHTALSSEHTTPATLRSALSAPVTKGLKFVSRNGPPGRVAAVRQLLDLEGLGKGAAEPSLDTFSQVLTDPSLLLGPARNRLLSLLGVTWLRDQDAWRSAVDAEAQTIRDELSAVQIVSPGTITQWSNQALIPITVGNELPYAVDVVVRTIPSSGRIVIDSDVTKHIPASASARVLIPVRARVSNGTVVLSLQLYTPNGVKVGDTAFASVTVHADWEGIGSIVVGVLLAGFFAFGVVRSFLRRRRERATDG